MSLTDKSLVSITDYTKAEWLEILKIARQIEAEPPGPLLAGKVVASLFFEPSTRTRLSFETAVQRLGGGTIGFADAGVSSSTKGETLKDTIRMVTRYADLIVMRHPREGSARLAAEVASVPVINAGDGANQHPTQTLLDLYSIQSTQGRFDGLTVAFVGDLKYGRTVHSLATALSRFDVSFIFVSPPELAMPETYLSEFERKGIPYRETADLDAAIPDSDILYMTRIQKERFAEPIEYEQVKDAYVLMPEALLAAKPSLRVLHPLPRVNEIDESVDQDKRAYYFEQAYNGLLVRQAIMACALGAV